MFEVVQDALPRAPEQSREIRVEMDVSERIEVPRSGPVLDREVSDAFGCPGRTGPVGEPVADRCQESAV